MRVILCMISCIVVAMILNFERYIAFTNKILNYKHLQDASLDAPSFGFQTVVSDPEQCFSALNRTSNRIIWHCTSELPQFYRPRKVVDKTIRLCIIGEPMLFYPVIKFLRDHPRISPTWLQIHIFGAESPRRGVLYWTNEQSAADSNEKVFDVCDGMIGLESKNSSLPCGLLQAVAYHRPILLNFEDYQAFEHQLSNEKVFSSNSTSTSMEMLLKYIDLGFFQRLPDCEVLIDNESVEWHYEILESLMVRYPLPAIPECDHNVMKFTFLISNSKKPFPFQRADSWKKYALSSMKDKYQSGRTVKRVVNLLRRRTNFHYQIKASCYCNEDDLSWLRNNSNAYCTFHEVCDDEFANSSQGVWVGRHTKTKHHVMTTLLPEFDHPRPLNITANFCVIGSPRRRDYGLLNNFLGRNQSQNIHFHGIGWGPYPKAMLGYERYFSTHVEGDFIAFNKLVYDLCDAVLSLITRNGQSYYFSQTKNKQTGSMQQGIAYQRPMVLHEDIAEPYRSLLPHIETHSDDPDSFAVAMNRMINKLQWEKI